MNDYWRTMFGWSVSRQRLWDECRLAYYYRYIARWEGRKGDMFREKMRYLANLKKLVFVRGGLIHDAVQTQVDHHFMGRDVSPESALNLYKMNIGKIRKEPERYLVEAVNGSGVDDEDFELLLREGEEQLEVFFNVVWPVYRELDYLQHEKFESFELDGSAVNVKIDLCTRNKHGEVVVTDWKTGKEWGDPATDIQMSTYILWASRKFGVPLDKVKGELVYLQNGKHVPAVRDQAGIDEAMAVIREGVRGMLAVSRVEEMPPSPEKERCRECAFATYCPEGKRVLRELGLDFSPIT